MWGDIPRHGVFLGAGVIAASGLLMILGEWWADRKAVGQLAPESSRGK